MNDERESLAEQLFREPYRFDFQTKREGSSVTVVGRSVVVLGKSNERYERVWNAVPRPEVSWRKAGAKRGSKPEKMGMIGDQVSMADLGGWPALWAPLDLPLETPGLAPGDEVEVQLVQKKNPLFGKVESDWKK